MFCRSLFVLFLLATVLSVLLRFTISDYPFGIFKFFFKGIVFYIESMQPVPSISMNKQIFFFVMKMSVVGGVGIIITHLSLPPICYFVKCVVSIYIESKYKMSNLEIFLDFLI